jgi:hypothetical protein
MKECPQGPQQPNKDNWEKDYPTQEAQDEFTKKWIFVGPRTLAGPVPTLYLANRGPKGEFIVYNPTMVKDLPLREVQTKIGYGINLDGKISPENFTSLMAKPGSTISFRGFGAATQHGGPAEGHRSSFRKSSARMF